MPVTDITTDFDRLEMVLTAAFPAPAERVWNAFTDPRQLERFWGPPGWPATFTAFHFAPGGRADYRMTGPTGETVHGSWEFTSIDPGSAFEVLDTFVDEDGRPQEGMPQTRMTFAFVQTGDGSRLVTTSVFPTLEALEQLDAMGQEDGMRQAFDQLDVVLQDLRDSARGKGTRSEILDDRHVRITRLVDGPADAVWRAHTDPDLVRRWLLGPDGWRMTVCEIDPRPGGAYRYAWEPEPGTPGDAFGFDGETVLIEPARRWVTIQRMTGTDHPAHTNDLSLWEEGGATLLTLVIEYPDAETRDMVLATGMTDGMEASYARLERDVL